jgi:hypothetical protein
MWRCGAMFIIHTNYAVAVAFLPKLRVHVTNGNKKTGEWTTNITRKTARVAVPDVIAF